MSAPNDTTLAIEKVDAGVRVSWSGGFPPYLLQKCDVFGGPWRNIGAPTLATGSTQLIPGTQGYFRVQQSVPLLDIDLTQPGAVLIWETPDFPIDQQSVTQPPMP